MKPKNKNKKIFYIGIIVVIIIIAILCLVSCNRKYSVTMYANGQKLQASVVQKNDKVHLPKAPKKKGYTFVGWYVDGKEFDEDTLITKDLKLEAKYIKNEYTITFDGGNGTLNKIDVKYKDQVKAPSNPTRENYVFSGWYLGSDEFDFNTKITSDLTLTAKWTRIVASYRVEHFLMGKDGNYSDNPNEVETLKANAGSTVNPKTKVYKGYTAPSVKKVAINSNGTTTVKYYYSINKYTLTVIGDKGVEKVLGLGSYFYNDKVTISYTLKPGYNFDGYSDNLNNNVYVMPDKDVTIKVNTSLITYDITYNLNGGSLDNKVEKYNVETKDFTLDKPTKTGYTFTGWKVNGSDSNGTIKKGTYGNLEVEAIFKANDDTKYKVEYYYMDKKGNYPEEASKTLIKEGTSDSKIDFVPEEKEGFKTAVLKDNEGNVVEEKVNLNADGSTVLKYYYERNKYTLTVSYINTLDESDKDGVKKISETNSYYFEEEVNVSIELEEGFDFIKWSNDDTNTSTTYKITSSDNQTLTASIKRHTYKVTFDSKNGSKVDSKETLFGKLIEKPSDPTRDGYDFDAWYYKENDVEKKWNFETDAMPTSNVELYAKWIIHKNTVVFDANGGVFKDGQEQHDITNQALNSKITNPEENPTKQGYTFAGWYKDQDCTEDNKWDFEKDKMPDNALILYAKWKANTYTIAYNGNTNTSGEMNNKTTCTYDSDCVLDENKFKKEYTVTYKNGYEKDNSTQKTVKYKFVGWTYEGSEDVLADGKPVRNLTAENKKEVTLVAKWEIDNETAVLETITRTGYSLDGWYDDSTKVDNLNNISKDLELTAHWTANTYEVEYNSNGGEGTMENSTYTYDEEKNLKDNEFTKTGYHFKGWSKSSSSSDIIEENKNYTDSGTITVYAVWEANKYTVTYDSNKGNGSSTPSGTVDDTDHTYDLESDLTKDKFEREGYTFVGWSKTKHDDSVETCDDCIEKANNLTDENNGNVTLYAVWKANTYTITYNSNKGSGSIEPTGTVENTTHTYDSESDLTSEQYQREGYTFVGWSKKANEKDKITKANNLTNENNGNVTLYAIWEIITYTINQDSNGGSLEKENKSYTIEDEFELSKPTRPGYTFDGWYTKNPESKVDKITKGMTGNLDLQAHWTGISYTIIYSNGESESARDTFVYGDSHTSKNPETVQKQFTVTFDEAGGKAVSDQTVNATVEKWKVKDSSDGKTYNAGESIEDLIIPTSTSDTVTLVPASYTYPTIQLPSITKDSPQETYLEYEFDGWYKENEKQPNQITVKDNLSLKAHFKNVVNTDQYINDNINDKTYISSTLKETAITANILKVNEKVTTVLTADGNFVQYASKLLKTPGVTSLTLNYNSKDYTLTSDTIYTKLQELAKAMTSTSKEKEESNRKLSSLYNKSFTVKITVGDNTTVKGKTTNTITYTTKFNSDYIVTDNYWQKLGTSVMSKVNSNYSKEDYRIVTPQKSSTNIVMEYHPNAENATLSSKAMGAGFKTALFNLLGNTEPSSPNEKYPLTAIKKLTLTYKEVSISATERDIYGFNWFGFLLGKLNSLGDLPSKTHKDLLTETVNIHLDLDENWALADDFSYPREFDYTLTFKKGS